MQEPHSQPDFNGNESQLLGSIRSLIAAIALLAIGLLAVSLLYIGERTGFISRQSDSTATDSAKAPAAFWMAPDPETIGDPLLKEQVLYGKELIQHTSRYLGPKGSVAQISNGLRVNDCFERSLNGQALDTNGREMQAIYAYIKFLGADVKPGEKAKGSGLKELAWLDRAADPGKGKAVYASKCQSCHQADGGGTLNPEGNEYTYPPLWGKNSYNDAAGLYRLSNFARYVHANMPLGATHENTLLTAEEAWDLAAYVNSQARPHKNTPNDWPDIAKKPVDHPFGPYADAFTETQHKFGPFKPILAAAGKH